MSGYTRWQRRKEQRIVNERVETISYGCPTREHSGCSFYFLITVGETAPSRLHLCAMFKKS